MSLPSVHGNLQPLGGSGKSKRPTIRTGNYSTLNFPQVLILLSNADGTVTIVTSHFLKIYFRQD